MIYCVIPPALADELYDKLTEYYKDDPGVEVIIDRRKSERRERGSSQEDQFAAYLRVISRAVTGKKVTRLHALASGLLLPCHLYRMCLERRPPIRQTEVLATKRMIERAMDEHGIESHVTVFDKSARKDGTFSREDFTY